MALRLDKSIVRGEIDNTKAGVVRGRVWLVGRPEPLELTLQGNAWRDVAGTRLTFENPRPSAESGTVSLLTEQTGVVGDITASRKVKHLLDDLDEPASETDDDEKESPPWEWRNAIYIEWFSERNGRVVIETCEFDMRLSEHAWTMDEAEDQAQRMANEHAMRDFMASIIQRSEAPPSERAHEPEEMTEDEWELQLQASERLTDAYMEAMDKYQGDPEEEDKTNFAMGWDHMIEGGDTEAPDRPWLDDADDAADDDAEPGEDWQESDDEKPAVDEAPTAAAEPPKRRVRHPLHQRTFDYTLRVMDFARLSTERASSAAAADTALDVFLKNSLQISGKAAAVLTGYGGAGEHQMPKGMILATLRRCLNWSNEALAALNAMKTEAQWQPHFDHLQKLESELFGIREDITNIRRELQS